MTRFRGRARMAVVVVTVLFVGAANHQTMLKSRGQSVPPGYEGYIFSEDPTDEDDLAVCGEHSDDISGAELAGRSFGDAARQLTDAYDNIVTPGLPERERPRVRWHHQPSQRDVARMYRGERFLPRGGTSDDVSSPEPGGHESLSCPYCYGQGKGTISYGPGSINGRIPGRCECCLGAGRCTLQRYYEYRGEKNREFDREMERIRMSSEERRRINAQYMRPGQTLQDAHRRIYQPGWNPITGSPGFHGTAPH